MDIVNSLITSLFGISVVFAALISLIVLINLQTFVLKKMHPDKAEVKPAETAATPAPAPTSAKPGSVTTTGKLELVDIDEKTAALVMAIVCDESGIPANELIFKSIRAIAE